MQGLGFRVYRLGYVGFRVQPALPSVPTVERSG